MRSCKVSISGQVYHICRRNGIGESGRALPTVSKHPCPLCLTVRSAKQRRRVPSAGLALSVIASRCHLSQSERPWQSAKFAVRHFTPCCRKGSRQALRSDFTPLPRALPLGELDAVRWPERARTAEGTLYLGLADAYDRADPRNGRKGHFCEGNHGCEKQQNASGCPKIAP